MKMKLLLFLLMTAGICAAQPGPFDLNFELQAYPTGLIPGVRLEKNFGGKNAASVRFGYQIIDHRGLGKHDDETGSGYGLSLGYRRFFQENYQGLTLGLRTDFWRNEIDWEDNGLSPNTFLRGTTEVTVVQPTAEAGYTLLLGENWLFTPTLSLGWEINVKTEGEPTGEGAILLLGVNLGRRF